jgi:hypothetical protein
MLIGEETTSNQDPSHNLAGWGSPPALTFKQSKTMALNWKKLEEVQGNINSIGTLQELAGAGATLRLNKNSLENKADNAPRLVVTVINKAGMADRVICSPAVSRGLRSKTIKVSQLLAFPITEQVTRTVDEETGEYVTINVITMPASEAIDINVDNIVVEEFKASTALAPEELLAF